MRRRVVVVRRLAVVVVRRRRPLVPPPIARCTRRWIVRSPRSTVPLAAAVPFAVNRSIWRFSLRFSLMSWSTIWFRLLTSSVPPTRRRALVVRRRVVVLRVPVRVVDVVDVSVVRHGGVAAVTVMGVTEVAFMRNAIGVRGGLILLIHGGMRHVVGEVALCRDNADSLLHRELDRAGLCLPDRALHRIVPAVEVERVGEVAVVGHIEVMRAGPHEGAHD